GLSVIKVEVRTSLPRLSFWRLRTILWVRPRASASIDRVCLRICRLRARKAREMATAVSTVLKTISFEPRLARRSRDRGRGIGAAISGVAALATVRRLFERDRDVDHGRPPGLDADAPGRGARPLVPPHGAVFTRRNVSEGERP